MRRSIPETGLDKKHIEFLEAWRIDRQANYLAARRDSKAIYIWAGRFVCNETVVITADEDSAENLTTNRLFVGLTSYRDYYRANLRGEPLEAFAASATHPANGIKESLMFLDLIKGLPDGSSLGIHTDHLKTWPDYMNTFQSIPTL